MTNPKGTDPARPVPGHFLAKGEDVRADFAKAALISMGAWTPPSDELEHIAEERGWNSDEYQAAFRKVRAEWAVAQADALVAALSHPNPTGE